MLLVRFGADGSGSSRLHHGTYWLLTLLTPPDCASQAGQAAADLEQESTSPLIKQKQFCCSATVFFPNKAAGTQHFTPLSRLSPILFATA